MATALYRRYRPEAFSEMIGQAHVTEPLMTALRAGRIGHAYLFSGPRGCGKTTSARVLARCLNCAEGPTDTPCGVCPSCVELSRSGGGSLDVVEIDAASHGGVEDARELRERAVFAPARDRYKIFIIDEAHMVTAAGFNALLKIVEEPPPHVKFIFATTEPEKVIGTIRSRTHHYPFRLIAPGALIDYAQSLCDSEGVRVEPGVLPLVVRAGGGSVRDTLSILDQLIAGSEGDSVAAERAAGLLGFTSSELLDEVVEALAAGDPAAAFGAVDRVVQTGQDPRRFVEDLLERLRDLIVISATTVQGASAIFRGVPEAQLQRMFEQTQAFGRGELSRIADTVSAALDNMAGATAPRLHLELLIARALVSQAPAPAPAPAPAVAPQAAPVPSQSSQPSQGSPAGRSAGQAAGSASAGFAQAPVQPVAPASQPASPAAPAASAADIISTMRSAREFLRSDSSGAPQTGHEASAARPATPAEPAAAAEPVTPSQPAGPASASTPAQSPAEGAGPAAASAFTPAQPGPSEGAAVEPVTVDELREIWPDVLEELLENDRDAWNAVRVVQPLELRGDVLYIGIANDSDLASFKTVGSGPLREALVAAVGLNVRYMPKRIPAGSAPVGTAGAPSTPAEAPGDQAEDPDPARSAGQTKAADSHEVASEPAEGATAAAQATGAQGELASQSGAFSGATAVDPVEARLGALLGAMSKVRKTPDSSTAPVAPSPAAASPSSPARPAGEFGDPGFSPDREPSYDPSYDPELPPEPPEDPYAGAVGDALGQVEPSNAEFAPIADPGATEGVPAPSSRPSSVASSGSRPDSAPGSAPAPTSAPAPVPASAPAPAPRNTAPAFTRYGEAVVREVLGARFVEERPLPTLGEG